MGFLEELKKLQKLAESFELDEKKPAKGKKWVTNGVSHGDPDYKISPGTDRGDRYCARSQGINDENNIDCRKTPNQPNCLSRKKWKCRGKKSLKESFEQGDLSMVKHAYKLLAQGDAISPRADENFDKEFGEFLSYLVDENILAYDMDDPAFGDYYFFEDEPTINEKAFIDLYIQFMEGYVHDDGWDYEGAMMKNTNMHEEDLTDIDKYAEYHKEMSGEPPFEVNGETFKYVWAKYPNDKVDVGVYDEKLDVVYNIDWFKKNVLKQIPEATSVGGMGGYSAFGYDAPAFMTPIKKKVYEYIKPLGGEYVKTKDGKKVTPKMIKEWLGNDLNETADKPFFKGGKIVQINPKCMTFPYCSQGDSEDKPIKLIGETKDSMDKDSWDYINEVAEIAKKKPEFIAKLIREYYLKSGN